MNVMLTRCKTGLVVVTNREFIARGGRQTLLGKMAHHWEALAGEGAAWTDWRAVMQETADLPGALGRRREAQASVPSGVARGSQALTAFGPSRAARYPGLTPVAPGAGPALAAFVPSRAVRYPGLTPAGSRPALAAFVPSGAVRYPALTPAAARASPALGALVDDFPKLSIVGERLPLPEPAARAARKPFADVCVPAWRSARGPAPLPSGLAGYVEEALKDSNWRKVKASRAK